MRKPSGPPCGPSIYTILVGVRDHPHIKNNNFLKKFITLLIKRGWGKKILAVSVATPTPPLPYPDTIVPARASQVNPQPISDLPTGLVRTRLMDGQTQGGE